MSQQVSTTLAHIRNVSVWTEELEKQRIEPSGKADWKPQEACLSRLGQLPLPVIVTFLRRAIATAYRVVPYPGPTWTAADLRLVSRSPLALLLQEWSLHTTFLLMPAHRGTACVACRTPTLARVPQRYTTTPRIRGLVTIPQMPSVTPIFCHKILQTMAMTVSYLTRSESRCWLDTATEAERVWEQVEWLQRLQVPAPWEVSSAGTRNMCPRVAHTTRFPAPNQTLQRRASGYRDKRKATTACAG